RAPQGRAAQAAERAPILLGQVRDPQEPLEEPHPVEPVPAGARVLRRSRLLVVAVDGEVPVDEAQPVAVRDPGPELEIGDLEQALVEEANLLERPAPQEHGGGLADPVLLEAGREQLAEEVTPLVDPLEP